MIVKHLKDLTEKIKDMYGYLRVLNLDKYVDVLRHSPGIEEYATLDKIVDILKYNVSKKEYDVIIFDTPPTGLTLRIMALPSISAIWVDKLMKLREAILDRRRIVERITGEKIRAVVGGRELEVPAERGRDPIYRELMKMRDEVSLVNSIIKNSEASVIKELTTEIFSGISMSSIVPDDAISIEIPIKTKAEPAALITMYLKPASIGSHSSFLKATRT